VLGTTVRPGQTLRFHIRDGSSADVDLREALATTRGGVDPTGAAVAGFCCGGEIGPVGSRAFLHGFNATLAVFLRG
jgi:small ligand-binding sensory domain FIST